MWEAFSISEILLFLRLLTWRRSANILFAKFKKDFLSNQQEYRKSLRHFCGSSPADWHGAACLAVLDNTKVSSVLHIKGCVHLPLQQVFKIIMPPDSTFYKLLNDIYFAKVLSLAMRVRTIFLKTLLKVYSTLKCRHFTGWLLCTLFTVSPSLFILFHFIVIFLPHTTKYNHKKNDN